MASFFFLIASLGCTDTEPSAPVASPTQSPKPIEAAEEPAQTSARLPSQLEREPNTRQPHEEDWFEEIAEASGVKHAYRSGYQGALYTLLETVGGGLTMVDYDQDGDIDLYFTGGGVIKDGSPVEISGLPSKLFRNDGDWKFTDVSESMQLPAPSFYSHGCNSADFNRDGWPDLLAVGYGGVQLLQNDEGKRFVDVTKAVKLDAVRRWCVQGAWVDVNRDGHLDLYLITYAQWEPDPARRCSNGQGMRDVCGPTRFEGQQDILLLGRGDGTFEDVTDTAGLVPENRGLGVVSVDFNEDRRTDLFVGNDVQFNQLYLAQEQLPFAEEGLLAGVAVSHKGEREGTMGVAVGDFNRDDRPDLWYTNFANQDNSLCENMGEGSFQNVSISKGLGGVSRPWVGFGTILADFNHDRWPDIFISNGHVAYERLESPFFQPPQLFQSQAGNTFSEVSLDAGPYFHGRVSGRGAAVGDLDNDGSLDLVVVHQDDPVAILRNRLDCPHWVRLKLVGTSSNTDAIGAKVSLLDQDLPLSAWVTGADSYASSSDRRVLFTLEEDTPVDIQVIWPSGTTEVFADLQPQKTHELVEGKGRTL